MPPCEKRKSDLVELIVETEAQAGATGFSVAGGGKEGVFVKEVLKDSRAAKAFSLQEGDQLLSARIYFDNTGYEDVLKILQCVEPYKVAYCLKRTVSSSEAKLPPGLAGLDLKAPEPKIAKLSIKSVTPVKKSQKKEKKVVGAGGDIAGETEIPVDVEFAIPKFSKFKKLKITSPNEQLVADPKGKRTDGEEQAKDKKKKLQLPGVRQREVSKVIVDVTMESQKAVGDVKVTLPQLKATGDLPEADLKTKVKMPSLSMFLPKKKSEDLLQTEVRGEVERPEGGLKAGLAEISKVEIDLGLSKEKGDGKAAEIGAKGPEGIAKGHGFKLKMPSFRMTSKGPETVESKGVKVVGGTPQGGEEAKLKMPKMKLPAVDISVPKMKETEGDMAVMGPKATVGDELDGLGGKVKDFGLKMPTIDILTPKVSVPDVDFSLPKVKADDAGPIVEDEGVEAKIKIPTVSLPTFGISSKSKEPEEAGVGEIDVKGPKTKMPSFEIALPKTKAGEAKDVKVAHLDVETTKVKMDNKVPKISEAKVKLSAGKTSSMDISVPKVPDVGISLPKVIGDLLGSGVESDVKGAPEVQGSPDLQFKIPKLSLPKFGVSAKSKEADLVAEAEVGLKGPLVKLPKFEISLPKMKHGDGEADLLEGSETNGVGVDIKGKLASIKMPTIDIASPRVKVPDVTLPKVGLDTSEGAVKATGVKVQALKMADVSKKSEVTTDGSELKAKMPQVSLPTFGISSKSKESEAEGLVRMEGKRPELDGQKTQGIKLEISLPKVLMVEVEPEMEVVTKMIKKDIVVKVSKESIKVKGPEMGFEDQEGKGVLPSIKMPTLGISAPQVKVPDVDLAFPSGKADVLAQQELGIQRDGFPTEALDFKLKLPKVSLPELRVQSKEVGLGGEVKGAEALTVSSPERKGKVEIKGTSTVVDDDDDGKLRGKEGRFKMPKFKMPTFGTPKKGGEGEDVPETTSKGKAGDVEVEGKGSPEGRTKSSFLKLSKFGISSFKGKTQESEGSSGGEGEKGKSPEVKVKAPKVDSGGARGLDLSIDGPDVTVKLPKFSMPKFGISGGKGGQGEEELEADIKAKAKAKGKDKAGSETEQEGPGGKLKMPKIKVPSFEISVPQPKKTGGEGTLPKAEVDVTEADLKAYGGELKIPKVKGETVGAEASEGHARFPSVKLPSIDISAPRVDLGLSLPQMAGDGGETATPLCQPDEDSAFKLKMPKFAMPKVALSGSKGNEIEATASDLSHQGPEGLISKLAKIDISLPKVKLSDADVRLLEGETETSQGDKEGTFQVLGVSLPKFPSLKPKGLELDFDISSPKGKSEAMTGSEGKMVEGQEFKLKMPKVTLPSFGLPSAQAEMEMSPPQADKSTLRGKAEKSKADGSPEVKSKGEKIKMPSFRIGLPKSGDEPAGKVEVGPKASKVGPKGESDERQSESDEEGRRMKIKLPKFGLSLKGVEGDVGGGESPKLDPESADDKSKASKVSVFGISLGKSKKPEVDIDLAKLDVGDPDGKLRGKSENKGETFKIKTPFIGLSTPKMVEIGVGLVKGKADTSVGGTKGTDEEVEEGSEFRLKMPKFAIPEIGISMPSRGEGDANAKLGDHPEAKTGSPGKASRAEVRRSKVDADLEGSGGGGEADGKLKMPKVKLPKVEMVLTKESGTREDGKNKMDAGGDDRESEGKVFLKMPQLEISAPKIGEDLGLDCTEGQGDVWEADTHPGGKSTILNIAMTSLGFSDSKEKRLSAEMAAMSVARPKDRQVEVRRAQVESVGSSEDKMKSAKVKLPKFGIELPKVSLQEDPGSTKPQQDVTVSGSQDVSKRWSARGGQRDGGDKGIDVSYKALKASGASEGEARLKGDKAKKSLFGISSPKVKVLDSESKAGEVSTDTPSPKGKSKSTGKSAAGKVGVVRTESPEAKAKQGSPKIRMPNFRISWSKGRGGDLNGEEQAEGDARVHAKGTDVKGTDEEKAKSKLKLKMPWVSLGNGEGGEDGDGTDGEGEGGQTSCRGEEGGKAVLGKLRLPKLELTSPAFPAGKDGGRRGGEDTEINLQLVQTEPSVSKGEGEKRAGSSSPRVNGEEAKGKGLKGKSPKLGFQGFKKKGGAEGGEASKLVMSGARTELASLESGSGVGHSRSTWSFSTGKSKGTYSVEVASKHLTASAGDPRSKEGEDGQAGEGDEGKDKSGKFRFPKLSLGPKSKGALEISAEDRNNLQRGGEDLVEFEGSPSRHFKFQMPKIGFTTAYHEERTSEERIIEEERPRRSSKSSKQLKSEPLTEKSTTM
eukprot:gi/632985994/ref/XP_007909994.1/ PREDICTED: periaxin [Callorhinchus milii]